MCSICMCLILHESYQGCQLATGSTKSWVLKTVIAQLEHLGRKLGALILSFLLCLKGRYKNKCHITDKMNHLLSLNCSVVPVSFVSNFDKRVALLWGPTLYPCPGWCLKGRLTPSPGGLCCYQWELEMSLLVHLGTDMLACMQYLPSQSWTLVAKECRTLEVRKISTLTNEYVEFFFLLKRHFLQ